MEEKYKIHAFYIIGILLSIIIGLIAVEWSKVDGLIEYITFALTLSSLILAILAIVYSIVSNTSLGKVLQNLHISSNFLKNTSKEIDESNKILLEEIKRIPQAIESVDKNVITTRTMIEELSLASLPNQEKGQKEVSTNLTKEIVVNFLSGSSIRGLESLFCVVLSHKTNTAFQYKDICDEIEGLKDAYDYLFAYFISATAFGLLSYTFDGKYRYIINDVHKTLIEATESQLMEKLEKAVKDSVSWDTETTEEKERERWFKSFIEIKAYFGIEL